ncbi:tyrosine-protein phosphatase YwqE [Saonia flava]|uniref:protein-tyrosine-phosphatase n=1 Tax=Saonia flava TaxID=523696 RepID=A0A846QMP5_9FLAO|nr:CpsB/CapC family capsule biosynthesis tyrosine phosphatase [Saonia flava]NJB70276.1 tyrosine-protein phosphatase YwqE [Saonia flava]
MFHFFSKKIYLVDYLEGFIDIHNHILPGIDDGAKTVEESIALIKGFSEFGVKSFVATPHIMHNYYPNTPTTIENSLTALKNELLKNNMKDISIEASAEHMIDDNFETILEAREVMSIRKNYLLIEMSYLQPSINFDIAIQKIATARYFPIFAHPERYGYLHNDFEKYLKYKEQGIMFQMNLLSLSEYYGKEVQKTAFKLLENNLIDFIATDVHNIRQLNSLKDIKVSQKVLDKILYVMENTIQSFY